MRPASLAFELDCSGAAYVVDQFFLLAPCDICRAAPCSFSTAGWFGGCAAPFFQESGFGRRADPRAFFHGWAKQTAFGAAQVRRLAREPFDSSASISAPSNADRTSLALQCSIFLSYPLLFQGDFAALRSTSGAK